MIRIFELNCDGQRYIGAEYDTRADIVEKYKRAKWFHELTGEVHNYTLRILAKTESLETAENLEQYYIYKRNPEIQTKTRKLT